MSQYSDFLKQQLIVPLSNKEIIDPKKCDLANKRIWTFISQGNQKDTERKCRLFRLAQSGIGQKVYWREGEYTIKYVKINILYGYRAGVVTVCLENKGVVKTCNFSSLLLFDERNLNLFKKLKKKLFGDIGKIYKSKDSVDI